MYILDVIPILKNSGREQLSYFSKESVALGSLVHVPVRKQEIPAVVVGIRDAADAKTEIKRAGFALKSILGTIPSSPFDPAFVLAAQRSKDHYLTTTGNLLFSLIPKKALTEEQWYAPTSGLTNPDGLLPEKFVLQTQLDDRIAFYRTYLREAFARNASVVICAPTIQWVEEIAEHISRGVEDRLITFHSRLSAKKLADNLAKLQQRKQAVAIVATPSYLFMPLNDVDTYILEQESNDAYRQIARPRADLRYFIEQLAQAHKASLIIADTFLRLETLHRTDEHELQPLRPLSFRTHDHNRIRLIDRSEEEKNPNGFSPLSPELMAHLHHTLDNSQSMLLYVSRRGLASITTCQDCGHNKQCHECHQPIVLHKRSSGREYRCHHCGNRQPITDFCENCNGNRLTLLGSTIDRVYQEVQSEFPDIPAFTISSDHTTTPTQIQKKLAEFYNETKSILITTRMGLPYIHEPVSSAAVVSLDTMISLPRIDSYKKIFDDIIRLNQCTTGKIIVQAKHYTPELHAALSTGNTLNLYQQELQLRQQLKYPPFAKIIIVTFTGTNKQVQIESARLKNYLAEASDYGFTEQNPTSLRIVMKFPIEIWESDLGQSIRTKLQALPMGYRMMVDPVSFG